MGMRMLPSVTARNLIPYWIGKLSYQFQDNWYRNTGTWLWGLTSFIEYRPPGPRESAPISDSAEWKELMDDLFQSN